MWRVSPHRGFRISGCGRLAVTHPLAVAIIKCMNAGRVVIGLTCLIVAAMGTWFALARWDDANKVAAVTSALAAVAAVGVAIWAALHTGSGADGPRVRIRNSGDAVAGPDGSANSGVRGAGKSQSVKVMRTGKAQGRDANSGVEL